MGGSCAAQCKLLGACSCVGLGWWPWGVEPSQTPCCNSFPILLWLPCSQPPPTRHAPRPTGLHPLPGPVPSTLTQAHSSPIQKSSPWTRPSNSPCASRPLFSFQTCIGKSSHLQPLLPPATNPSLLPPIRPFCHQSVPPAENTPGSLKCFPPGACLGLGCTGMHRIIQKQLCDAPAAQISWCAEIPPRLELLQPF